MRSVLNLLILTSQVLGFQFLLPPDQQFCITQEPSLDFDLLIDLALTSDNSEALMDV